MHILPLMPGKGQPRWECCKEEKVLFVPTGSKIPTARLTLDQTWGSLLGALVCTRSRAWALSFTSLVQFARESCCFSLVRIPHPRYLIKFLIPHPWYMITLACLQQDFCQVCVAGIPPPPYFPLVILYPPSTSTLLPGCKCPLVLVFGVESNRSALPH